MLDRNSAGRTASGTASTRKTMMFLHRQPERDVTGADHPVLAEPVQVHQYLVAGVQDFAAAFGVGELATSMLSAWM